MASKLQKEFQWYLDHQEQLVKEHRGKVLVIKGGEVIGVYDTEAQALFETNKVHEPGTFLIQRCEPGAESYTQTYHSRVAFG